MERVEAPRCHATVDCSRMEPETDELGALDGAMLLVGEVRNQSVRRTRKSFATHSVVKFFWLGSSRHHGRPCVTALLPE
jgi:hypothetical protein